MKIEDRQRLLTVVAVAAVALLLADRFVVEPLISAWKERSTRITELRRKVDDGSKMASREPQVHDQWQQMRKNALPSDPSLAEQRLFKALEDWSRTSRISITALRPQWKQGGEDYKTLECRVDASGSLESVTRFLYEIEKDPLALKMESVELTARDNNGRQLALGLLVSALSLQPASR